MAGTSIDVDTAVDTAADTAAGVLAGVRASRRVELAEQARQLALAVAWASMHSTDSIYDAACFGGETELLIAGPGAPLVAEFCVAEFAAALGMPTEQGKGFLGEAVELAHRLPRVYARVQAGDLPGWRARRIARATIVLSAEAAGFVDRHLAPVAHRVGPTQTDRLITEATARFMPDQASAQAAAAAEQRHVSVLAHHVSFDGTVKIDAEVDLGDALDFEAAITTGAAQRLQLGSTDTLPVRRAAALGDLARGQLGLHLTTGTGTGTGTGTAAKPVTKPVVLYLHLSDQALSGHTPSPVGRVENTSTPITVDQIKAWCGNPFAHVTVKPVLDLTDHVHVGAYEVPDRIAEAATLRDLTCVFPWCTRRARTCDTDHVHAHSDGGATCTENTAPLCRRHHRLKTHHSGWTYTTLEPGSYLWTSPHGYQFLRDHQGTTDVSRHT